MIFNETKQERRDITFFMFNCGTYLVVAASF